MKSLEITNEQLMKAIECCLIVDCDTCDYCPLYDRDNGCTEDGTYTLLERAFDLIKRQQMEIEEQDQAIINALHRIGEVRIEATKEFAERLKQVMFNEDFLLCEPSEMANLIDNLVKEMTEVKDDEKLD